MVGWDSLTHILQSRYNYWRNWLLCIQCISEKNEQTKTMLHKSLTKWYFHLLNNFPLSNPPSSEAATAHKKWSVPWTAPPAYRLNMTSTTTSTTTITVTTFAEILTCVVRHSFLWSFLQNCHPCTEDKWAVCCILYSSMYHQSFVFIWSLTFCPWVTNLLAMEGHWQKGCKCKCSYNS